ncbi:MAG: alpha-1,2-fucosyltransferase [Prevotella sp.]|nr:alpha-1,2-fucosyltransferase [Prevotella sp.]
MIVVKFNGGLGNQLFQYAFGRALQLRYKDSYAIDVEEFRRSYGHVPRHYSLGNFNLPDDVKLLSVKKSRSLLAFKVFHKVNSNLNVKLASFFDVYWWRNPVYKDLGMNDTKGRKCYFYGYWQSEKYFYDYRDTIKKELKVKTPIVEESRPYAALIEKTNAVCLHIRRGDFVKEGMIICDRDYYQRGIDYMVQHTANPRFFIFTNDNEWVRENVKLPADAVFVDVADPDYEVLRLMYMCKHFIISNSSFSWWGQYLADHEEKIVVAPKSWSVVWPNEKSIYLDNWVIL